MSRSCSRSKAAASSLSWKGSSRKILLALCSYIQWIMEVPWVSALMQRPDYRCLIIFVLLLILLFPVRVPVTPNLPHSLCDPLILLILGFIPLNVVLARYLLYFFPISIRFFDQTIPLLYVKAFILIELRLPAANREVEG